LRVLDLGRTRITDSGLAYLKHLACLQRLDLSDTKVTDAVVAQLANSSALELLLVDDSAVTETGRQELLRALPQLKFTVPRRPARAIPPRTSSGSAARAPGTRASEDPRDPRDAESSKNRRPPLIP
jgi:hypothetical protein